MQRKKSHKAHLDLSFEVTQRMRTDHVFEAFNAATGADKVLKASGLTKNINFDCLKTLVSAFDKDCGHMDDYSLQYVKYFAAACEGTFSVERLSSLVKTSCSH